MKICDLCKEEIKINKDYTNTDLGFPLEHSELKNFSGYYVIKFQLEDLAEHEKINKRKPDICDYCVLTLILTTINKYFKEQVDERLKQFAERNTISS